MVHHIHPFWGCNSLWIKDTTVAHGTELHGSRVEFIAVVAAAKTARCIELVLTELGTGQQQTLLPPKSRQSKQGTHASAFLQFRTGHTKQNCVMIQNLTTLQAKHWQSLIAIMCKPDLPWASLLATLMRSLQVRQRCLQTTSGFSTISSSKAANFMGLPSLALFSLHALPEDMA